MAYSEENIIRAETILKEAFTRSLLAGDRRGIHERLARILPAGAYTLCNLLPGTEDNPTPKPGPSGRFRENAPRGYHRRQRRTPYGATSRPAPPIPLAYLTTQQREDLQRLEEEKGKQSLARHAAGEIRRNIAQEERRLATVAQLNLQQAELDLKKAALHRTVRPAGPTPSSMLTPLLPMLTIQQPTDSETTEPKTSNDKEMSEKTIKRFDQMFGPPNLVIAVNTEVDQTDMQQD